MSQAHKLCTIVLQDSNGRLGKTLRPISPKTQEPAIPASVTAEAAVIYDATNNKIIKCRGDIDIKRMGEAIISRLAANTIPYLEVIYHPDSSPKSNVRTICGYFDRESGFRCCLIK